MSTFALVHGAWHGAWCWEALVPELERRGHRAITMDLPCDDPAATFEDYADAVAAAVPDDAGDDLVLVGHSLGGYTIPLVPQRRPVKAVVYLCALVPIPGRSLAEQAAAEPDMLLPRYLAGVSEPDERGRVRWVDARIAAEVLFADCDERAARDAIERLRPQAQRPYAGPCPLEALPDAPATYVVCRDDRIVNPTWSRRVATERLDARLVELPGSHSPFLSRPAQLASVLEATA
ncbi:MAG TPA: alpha/beta hydrolase [Solirubrobacteraceae bacterium]|nr:alpha/beta hydrolase [Solirubrobacteraceae bacterium]